MPRHNPSHPGLIITEDWVEALGLSVAESAPVLSREASSLTGRWEGFHFLDISHSPGKDELAQCCLLDTVAGQP